MCRLLKIWLLYSCICLVHIPYSFGQKKNEPEKKPIVADTIIYETKPLHEKKETEILHLYETKETIIKIKNPNKAKVRVSDKPIDTSILIKKGTPVPIVRETGNCACVEMSVKAQDTVEYGQYVNYTFKFKNSCRDVVYIHSSSFSFKPFNYFNQPVKVIRKISFVKRFDLPDFVAIQPRDSFEFRFADDAFFEYDLHRHQQYNFKFLHSNSSFKSKVNPSKTYLCTEIKNQEIFVK